MTPLEDRLYLALLGARPIVAAQASLDPAAIRIADLVNRTLQAYKDEQAKEAQPEKADGEG